MALKLRLLVHFALYWLSVTSIPLLRRQGSPQDLDGYIKSVKTALYVIDNIKAGNARASCLDSSFESTLNSEGLDGTIAKQELCETASGFDVVDTSDNAVSQLGTALDGLNAIKSGSLSQVETCSILNEDTLDMAGVDVAGIKTTICKMSSLKSVLVSSTSSGVPSTVSNAPSMISGTSSISPSSTSDLNEATSVLQTSSTSPTANSSEALSSSTPVEPTTSTSITPVTSEEASPTSMITSATSMSTILFGSSQQTTMSRSANVGPSPSTLASSTIITPIPSNSGMMTIPTIVNSTYPIYSPIIIATITRTKWIDSPPLSFVFPTSSDMNTTTTITVTSTSTIEATTTIFASVQVTTSKDPRVPWQGTPYGSGFPPFPYRSSHRWPVHSGAALTTAAPSSQSAISDDECTEETTIVTRK